MDSKARVVVRVTRNFSASAERVFDAFLDPALAGRFMFATSTGKMVRTEIDPRVGGKYVFVDRREGEDILHDCEFLEIRRPRRLAFTFSVPKFSTEGTKVTIDIKPLKSGCELTLTHENVYAEYSSRTESGWSGILDGLAKTLS